MRVETDIQQFKMQLLIKMPFYGDILTQLSFVEDKRVQTAATDGRTIWYNPKFLGMLPKAQMNFVLMHEVFHVILRHGTRNADAKRDRDVWNIACDIIVNDMLLKMVGSMGRAGIPFDKPPVGVFAEVAMDETAENLYAKIQQDNQEKDAHANKMKVRKTYRYGRDTGEMVPIPSDIRVFGMTPEEAAETDQAIQNIIRGAMEKGRGSEGSCYIPPELYTLTESKKLDWRKLLKTFLTQEISDDSSYTTPERKYLHMDLILPGHSLTEETLDEVWAFVDSSGSIAKEEMSQFLTQLYRICREFKCVMNICYWDTAVTDVYTKIRKEQDIFNSLPKHSGGTDINCVYQWMHEHKVKPDVMLILTDGYFGRLTNPHFRPRMGKNTILVLSSDIRVDADMKRIGKIAKL